MHSPEFTYSTDDLRQLVHDALDRARARGASDCEAQVSEGTGLSVSVRLGTVETIEHNRDKGLDVSVYFGQRRGHASSADFSPSAVRATVDAACDIARFTAQDPYAGLAEASCMATGPVPDLSLFHPWEVTATQAIDLARRCEEAAFAVSPDIRNSEGASVCAQQGQFMAANSRGFMGGYASSHHWISCVPIAAHAEDMQRDDWATVSRHPHRLASPESVGDYAARRALSRLGARRLPTGRMPVLLEAPLACGLIGSFVHALSGGAQYRKASFLLDCIGQQIFPDWLTIEEDPHLLEGHASAPFDQDGVATRARTIVRQGCVLGYFLSAYSARKLGMHTTGNAGGSHNLLVSGGGGDLPTLLKTMDRGLFVTELLGHGINMVTGDYSRGAAGYWVENGQIQYPVHEMTIAGNLRTMFRHLVALGDDVDRRGGKQCGSALLEELMVAGL
jgi:PmbA protein